MKSVTTTKETKTTTRRSRKKSAVKITTDKVVKASYIQNIRRRNQLRERAMGAPQEQCKKCGCEVWDRDYEPDTWYCFTCGNRAYFNGTGYTQQSTAGGK